MSEMLGRDQILIASGHYTGNTFLQLRSGVSLYGGYSADFQRRTDVHSVYSADAGKAVYAMNLTERVLIDGVDVTTTDRSERGAVSIAVMVENSADYLTLRDSNIIAGGGGNGAAGMDGADGTPGSRGENASAENSGDGGFRGGGREADVGRIRVSMVLEGKRMVLPVVPEPRFREFGSGL